MSSDAGALVDLTTRFLRAPVAWGADPSSLVFSPPLTTDEAATFGQLQTMIALGLDDFDPATLALLWPQVQVCAALLTLGPTDPDYALDATFLANASPTNADAVAALKALIRLNARTLAAQQALIRIVRFMFVAGAKA